MYAALEQAIWVVAERATIERDWSEDVREVCGLRVNAMEKVSTVLATRWIGLTEEA
jgi:hypothetical protein